MKIVNHMLLPETQTLRPKQQYNKLLSEINETTIKTLKAESNKNIWIVGGGELITTFFNQDAIDDMILSVIPIVLGKGIHLFPNEPKETRFGENRFL